MTPGCEWSRCQNETAVIFYGHRVCEEHYEQHCDGLIDLKNTFDIKEDPE